MSKTTAPNTGGCLAAVWSMLLLTTDSPPGIGPGLSSCPDSRGVKPYGSIPSKEPANCPQVLRGGHSRGAKDPPGKGSTGRGHPGRSQAGAIESPQGEKAASVAVVSRPQRAEHNPNPIQSPDGRRGDRPARD